METTQHMNILAGTLSALGDLLSPRTAPRPGGLHYGLGGGFGFASIRILLGSGWTAPCSPFWRFGPASRSEPVAINTPTPCNSSGVYMALHSPLRGPLKGSRPFTEAPRRHPRLPRCHASKDWIPDASSSQGQDELSQAGWVHLSCRSPILQD